MEQKLKLTLARWSQKHNKTMAFLIIYICKGLLKGWKEYPKYPTVDRIIIRVKSLEEFKDPLLLE